MRFERIHRRTRTVINWTACAACLVALGVGCETQNDGDSANPSSCGLGQTRCGSQCTDTSLDPQNCGQCGVSCSSGQLCQTGACVCQPGLVDCGGTCVNTQSSGTHCGSCDVICPANTVCAAGSCVASCPTGTTTCDGGCVDVATDPFNCGSCGTLCPAGRTCNGGVCGCPVGQTDCAGVCVNTANSVQHCGGCNIACPLGQICESGVCGESGTGGVSSSGGTGTGGTGTGGTGTGGTGTGGTGTGGTETGGTPTGGVETGGAPTGGSGGNGTGGYLCDVGVWDGNPPAILSLSGSLGTHDPTMIEADGVFYRFDTGRNIPAFRSTDLLNWQSNGSVYNGNYPPQWLTDFRNQHGWTSADNADPWAPDVTYFGGQYHLYSSNSLFFGRNISCISHLTTSDIASGTWTDQGTVVCTDGSQQYNAIDADVELDANGTPWLTFGSFWSQAIQAVELDQQGNRVGSEMHHLAHASAIEAPVLFRRCGYYYLFVTHGLCCPNTTEAERDINRIDYRVVVGRSESILGPYYDKDGNALTSGGGTLMVQGSNTSGEDSPYAAAGHSEVIVSGNQIYHFYHAYPYSRNPYAELRVVEMPFDGDGWPVPATAP